MKRLLATQIKLTIFFSFYLFIRCSIPEKRVNDKKMEFFPSFDEGIKSTKFTRSLEIKTFLYISKEKFKKISQKKIPIE